LFYFESGNIGGGVANPVAIAESAVGGFVGAPGSFAVSEAAPYVTTPQLSVLAGGQIDGPILGIRVQNGTTYFLQRFALRPHAAYDPVAAMKFALEHQNPFVTGAIIGKEIGLFPADTFSMLSVDNSAILIWAVKPPKKASAAA
jgi:hypothetical protein